MKGSNTLACIDAFCPPSPRKKHTHQKSRQTKHFHVSENDMHLGSLLTYIEALNINSDVL